MLIDYTRGQTGVVLRVKMQTTSGLGQTGISSASPGLVISTIADVEAAPVAYTQAGGTIGAVATLGTYAAPSAGQCNIKAVSDANHPGVVEIHLADARYAVAGAKSLLVSWSGVSGMADGDALVPLRAVNPYDGASMGLANLDIAVSTRSTFAGGAVASVTAPVTLSDKTGFSLAANGLDAVGGFGTWNLKKTVQAIAAFLFAKRSGVPAAGQTGTISYQDNAGTSYGTVVVDTQGDITTSALTPPG